MVHLERYVRHEPFRDYATRDKLCRELEREYNLTVDNGREQRREDALTPKAATIEAQTGQQSFESFAKRHKSEIMQALEQVQDGSAGWQALHEALQAHGMGISRTVTVLLSMACTANTPSRPALWDQALSAKRLQERFGSFQPDNGLRKVQELSRYQAVPHRSPERGELYTSFKSWD